MQTAVCILFFFFGWIPKSGITGLKGAKTLKNKQKYVLKHVVNNFQKGSLFL